MHPITWRDLQREDQLSEIVEFSYQQTCLIFKHSTRCSLSSIAKMRLEDSWAFSEDNLRPYILDLIQYRAISDRIEQDFGVKHESPQILVIEKGEVTLDASHLDITVEEISSVLVPTE
ncbi:MAG: bacillithiol system redox-active protein YtxJ [Saprospiraceae bacterium]|nr:bacillithiol system redox-active protein YtxJ [Saprospiraceae bacterium]